MAEQLLLPIAKKERTGCPMFESARKVCKHAAANNTCTLPPNTECDSPFFDEEAVLKRSREFMRGTYDYE